MKITNYKEEAEAEERLERLRKRQDELQNELWPLQTDINEVEDAIADYNMEQSALDE